uniref:L-type lectin-like domain-containing protein n=2 Tax=Rhodosorus marinus TaxID=101924 RepID=A0A7S2ZW13_9RHOD|mmetsp:Transcript_32596/g.127854  ORF Transcript_32596/g.127854 Transcript_32596/m.127854 type:complete len:376 (+) Transcript_32596:162-1289(+)
MRRMERTKAARLILLSSLFGYVLSYSYSEYPPFALGEGDPEYSIQSPYKMEGNSIKNWAMTGSSRVMRDVERMLILLNYGMPSQTGMVSLGLPLRTEDFYLYADLEIRLPRNTPAAGLGIAIWFSNGPILSSGPAFGALEDIRGTGIILQPDPLNQEARLVLVTANGADGDLLRDMQTKSSSELEDMTYCSAGKYSEMKRIFVSYANGTLKVWIKDIPGEGYPKLCIEKSIPSLGKYVAVSASTAVTEYSEHYVHTVQIRPMEKNQLPLQPRMVRNVDPNNHHERIDTKLYDLQATLATQLNRPNTSEKFLKDLRFAMDGIFTFLGKKEMMMDDIINLRTSKDAIQTHLRTISQSAVTVNGSSTICKFSPCRFVH